MINVAFRPLQESDAPILSSLLESSPSDYIKYFHPFSFDAESINKIATAARKDVFTAIQLKREEQTQLAGFYMLRGLDEGYPSPMYGVFIAYEYRNRGLGRLTLVHAETVCRVNHIERLMLKVHPENKGARKLYEALGFRKIGEDPANKNLVMEKSFGAANER